MTTTVATVDVTDYYFSSDNFCAFSCHVMENTVYKEMQQSKHWKTPSGVRPKCADCHVSGRLTFAMWDHFVGTGQRFFQSRGVRGSSARRRRPGPSGNAFQRQRQLPPVSRHGGDQTETQTRTKAA